ncbi:MAG: archaellin/type IV pilin N-terminal domain-containing protein [archaeon]
MKLMRDKRAVSPLIATVLLIAFAVALGAVVMNWGKTQVEGHMVESQACEGVSLSWYKRNEIEQVCYRDDLVAFSVESGPRADIDDVKMIIDGENDIIIKESVFSSQLIRADVKKATVPYDVSVNGKVLQIKLTPKMKTADKEMLCTENALVKYDPPRCAE